MEEEPGKQPPLPPNYVSLAQLQEQRRLKLERQRREEEEEAARRFQKEQEEEKERERAGKVAEEGEERREARRPRGTTQPPAQRGGRRGPTRWSGSRGETGAPGADPQAGSKGVGAGREGGRRGGLCRWNRRGYVAVSKSSDPGVEGAKEAPAAAAAAIGGKGDSLDRNGAEGRVEVKGGRHGVAERSRKERPEGDGRAPEPKLVERRTNAGPVQPCKGQEGAKVTGNGFQSSTGTVDQRAKLSNSAEANGTAEITENFKDLSIAVPKGDEVGAVGKGTVEHWRQRSARGRRGRYPTFRANGVLGPQRRWRPAAEEGMVWVRKAESS